MPVPSEFFDRLAAYEDTGLTPEQCAEYAKADREGRYIVMRDAEQAGVKAYVSWPRLTRSFALVVFDPPHLRRIGENAWLRKKYGQLGENWREMLHDGFRECMRVLKPDGVLIFKWEETQIQAADVWAAIGERPLFGHHSGKKSQTFWGCFMKLEED